MNIWDSVHRSLEKASQEAARIAKTQRLRFTIDALSRQINTHNSTLVSKVMELFTAGQLTQSELLPLCQELNNLQQQVEQANNELRLLQNQGPQSTPANPYTGPGETAPTMYAPPPPPSDYQQYEHNTIAAPPPPPPPPGGEPLTTSAIETVAMDTEYPLTAFSH